MPVANPRGAPVIYVAGSARELPAEVQDWLSRADTRAVASPHLYDMLAQLARRRKFAAIIVNVQSVDWNEMDFFDHLARLSRHTPVFVTGPHQHRAKLEAACRRGARLFDANALDEELTQSVAPELASCTTRAGSVRAGEAQQSTQAEPQQDRSAAIDESCSSQASWPRVRLADPEALAAEFDQAESGLADSETPESELPRTADVLDAGADPTVHPEPVFPPDPALLNIPPEPDFIEPELVNAGAPEPKATSAGSPDDVRGPAAPDLGSDQTHGGSSVSTSTDPTLEPASPIIVETENDDQPAVRLAASCEEADTEDRPVLFPWSSSPNRPKRTPPAPLANTQETQGLAGPPASPEPPESPFRSVRLTPEEISALMGQPPRRQAPEGQV